MPKSGTNAPILIAGGGIGGLSAALALARRGRAVRLLEQSSQFSEIGAGIQLGPNVFRMFDRLGVTDEIKRHWVVPENLIMMDCITAEEVTRVPLGRPFIERFGHHYAVIHRGDLHKVLLDACRARPEITLETGHKVARIDEIPSGVQVTTTEECTVTGAALVGCDGLWSVVRGKIVGDGRPRVSGHVAYRAVLPTSQVPEELRLQSMVIWCGEKTHLVQYPLRGGELFNLVAVFHSNKFAEGWDAFGDVAELHERFAGTCSQVRTLLGKIESWRMWVLCDRDPVRTWSRGNITLLGDAAHPTLQYLAQGANFAIEDAVCLADQVERHGRDHAAAFLAYQQARYIRAARLQLTSRLYGEVFHASGATRDLRNAVLGDRTPAQAYDGMAWIYDYQG